MLETNDAFSQEENDAIIRAKRESLNLSWLVRNSLGGREAAVADAAAAAISAEEREKSQRRLSLSLRTGRLSNE